jgi:hypothetical protein
MASTTTLTVSESSEVLRMKIQTKTLAIALATAAVAGGAQAAIDSDGGTVPFSGTGDGELFFSAISRTDQRSITVDLGVSASALRANPAAGFSQTYAPLASFLSTATGPVLFNVGAISNVDLNAGADPASWGILTTASSPVGQLLGTDINQINAAMSNAGNFLFNVNLKAGNNSVALNNIVVETNTASGAYHDGGFWGQTWGGAMPFSTEDLATRSLPFYFLTLDLDADPSAGISKGVNVLDGYAWTVSADGTVKYARPAASVVPLPAGLWLLGAGFVGLLGLGRGRDA